MPGSGWHFTDPPLHGGRWRPSPFDWCLRVLLQKGWRCKVEGIAGWNLGEHFQLPSTVLEKASYSPVSDLCILVSSDEENLLAVMAENCRNDSYLTTIKRSKFLKLFGTISFVVLADSSWHLVATSRITLEKRWLSHYIVTVPNSFAGRKKNI